MSGEVPRRNPESMRETPLSLATPVIEANEIVFQAARTMQGEGKIGFYVSKLAKAATLFIFSGYHVKRPNK